MKLLFLFVAFFLPCAIFAQAPAIEWQRTYGSDYARSIQQTSDGGYIVAGQSSSNISGHHGLMDSSDCWIVKLSTNGTVEWQKSLGSNSWDDARSIQQTYDGGYVFTGVCGANNGDVTGNHGDWDYWVVKLSANGAIEWQKSLGGSAWDDAHSIQQTKDSGFVIAGFAYSHDGDVTGRHKAADSSYLTTDFWIVKLSANGTLQWQKSLGGSDNEVAFFIQQTKDSGYIVAGESWSNDGDVSGHHKSLDSSFKTSDAWIVKLTTTGTIEWQKSLGGSDNDVAYSIQQTNDGGYIVAGASSSNDGNVTGNHGGNDAWVVKLSTIGDIQWQKSMGGSNDDVASSIQLTKDGGFIIAGASSSNDGDVTGNHGGADDWIVKLSAIGNIQWQKSMGGSNDDYASSIQLTKDGGYIIAGSSQSNNGDVKGNSMSGFWIVKLASDANDVQELPTSLSGFNSKGNFPNPAHNFTNIEFDIPSNGNVSILIYNQIGTLIQSLDCGGCNPGINFLLWNCNDFNGYRVPSGVYFYEIHFGNDVQKKKLVVAE